MATEQIVISPPLAASADVVVVGSGTAGASAAIAAARGGASVVVIEKQAFMGGTSTAVLDTFYGFYTPGSQPHKIAGGISDDVVAGLRGLGPVLERPNTYGAGTGVTYNSEHLKLVWERLASDAGVRVLLHSFLQGATVKDGRVSELLVASKRGLVRIAGGIFIDASGDADLVYHAGFGFELAGAEVPAQTLTTTFRMVNVDIARRKQISTAEVHERMAAAAGSGDYELPRREGSDHIDPALLSEAEMAGRRQAVEYARFLVDRVPGYEDASLVALSSQIGVRETRRVYGDYRMTREDVLGARRFDDEIGLCGAPIEDHHPGADTRWQYLPDGEVVGIPFRSLIVRDAANVLVAGRCFSATHDAHASVRSMAQTMAMGQAAGTAAAMASVARGDPREVDVAGLRDHLRADGAVLEIASEPTPVESGIA